MQNTHLPTPPLPSGCPNLEIGWPFLRKGLSIGICPYFSADSATKKHCHQPKEAGVTQFPTKRIPDMDYLMESLGLTEKEAKALAVALEK
jgi:hypothetical protein